MPDKAKSKTTTKRSNKPTSRKASKSGGSLASDAVVAAVQPAAFDKLDAQFTNELSASVQKGGCGVCKKPGLKCLCVGGAGWKAKAMAKTKEAIAKLKSKPKSKTSVKRSTSAKRGGGVADNAGPAMPAYNYDGMMQESALVNSANNPGAATPLPFKAISGGNARVRRGGGLKKLSELSVGEGYSLHHNKIGGGNGASQFPIGISYKPAIVNSGAPVGYSPRTGLAFNSSPLSSMTDTVPSTVPAPMTKAVQFGNNITDTAPPTFNYGSGTPAVGGGLVKKLVVAAVAHQAYKKYKAHKKAKAAAAAASKPQTASPKKSSTKH